jgi:hypothetical protein
MRESTRGDAVCDRCGREPGRIRGTIPYCWRCIHECTFAPTGRTHSHGSYIQRRTDGEMVCSLCKKPV